MVSSREPGRATWVESGEYDLCPKHWESICTFARERIGLFRECGSSYGKNLRVRGNTAEK